MKENSGSRTPWIILFITIGVIFVGGIIFLVYKVVSGVKSAAGSVAGGLVGAVPGFAGMGAPPMMGGGASPGGGGLDLIKDPIGAIGALVTNPIGALGNLFSGIHL